VIARCLEINKGLAVTNRRRGMGKKEKECLSQTLPGELELEGWRGKNLTIDLWITEGLGKSKREVRASSRI